MAITGIHLGTSNSAAAAISTCVLKSRFRDGSRPKSEPCTKSCAGWAVRVGWDVVNKNDNN
jgi:hypothetical protein